MTTINMIQVEVPCDMEAGYTFMATYEDLSFPVTVPAGGVHKGELISVPHPGSSGRTGSYEVTPFITSYQNQSQGLAQQQEASRFMPQQNYTAAGRWRDSLFDCLRFGPFHPTFWNALCCPQILMAQVLTRMKMNWFAERAPDHEWRRTFPRILGIVVFYWAVITLLSPPSSHWETDANDKWVRVDPTKKAPALQIFLYNTTQWCFGLYTLIVLTRLRSAVRLQYGISTMQGDISSSNPVIEDCCVSFWCGCCSVAQMARQTADYEMETATCCSPTGLSS